MKLQLDGVQCYNPVAEKRCGRVGVEVEAGDAGWNVKVQWRVRVGRIPPILSLNRPQHSDIMRLVSHISTA